MLEKQMDDSEKLRSPFLNSRVRNKYIIIGYLLLCMSYTDDVPEYYTDDVPENLMSPERALRSVDLISEEFEEREGATDLVSFSVRSYPGKK
jgi:hypothetical protein